ncbi:MAG: Heimdall-CTERM domain-containing surface protein [Promethearchaeota archaeon]
MKKYMLIILPVFAIGMIVGLSTSVVATAPSGSQGVIEISTPESYVLEQGGGPDPWQNVTDGQRVNITAGKHHQFRTEAGNLIRLQVNASVQLQLHECEENPAGPLLNGTRAVNRYMHLELNCSCDCDCDCPCEMNATLMRNFTHAELGLLQGDVSQFRWAFYDEASAQWQYAFHNWVEMTDKGATVGCDTDHFSIWTILAPAQGNPNPGQPFDAPNGTAFALQNGSTYQIRTQNGFQIQLQVGKDVALNITEHNTYQHQNRIQNRYQMQTQFMSIHMNESAPLNATLSREFTQGELNKIQNRSRLRFMFYNESSGAWEAPQHQWLEGNTLYCNTTHFSTWTILEDVGVVATPGFELLPVFLALIPVAVLVFLKRKK